MIFRALRRSGPPPLVLRAMVGQGRVGVQSRTTRIRRLLHRAATMADGGILSSSRTRLQAWCSGDRWTRSSGAGRSTGMRQAGAFGATAFTFYVQALQRPLRLGRAVPLAHGPIRVSPGPSVGDGMAGNW